MINFEGRKIFNWVEKELWRWKNIKRRLAGALRDLAGPWEVWQDLWICRWNPQVSILGTFFSGTLFINTGPKKIWEKKFTEGSIFKIYHLQNFSTYKIFPPSKFFYLQNFLPSKLSHQFFSIYKIFLPSIFIIFKFFWP